MYRRMKSGVSHSTQNGSLAQTVLETHGFLLQTPKMHLPLSQEEESPHQNLAKRFKLQVRNLAIKFD